MKDKLCLDYLQPGPNTTCDSILETVKPPITLLELYNFNPGLNCNNLTSEVRPALLLARLLGAPLAALLRRLLRFSRDACLLARSACLVRGCMPR